MVGSPAIAVTIPVSIPGQFVLVSTVIGDTIPFLESLKTAAP